jgi:photosystem II stability/assembly factor-like uncharacterized protein
VNIPLTAAKLNRASYGVVVGGTPEIWIVGDSSSIYRSLDGKTWINASTAPALPTLPAPHNLTGVYITVAAGVKHYFVIGDGGFMAHLDASKPASWTPVTGCGTSTLQAIHGTGLATVYAVGPGSSLYSVDTTNNLCTTIALPAMTSTLNGVFVDSSRVWMVGDSGTVLSYTLASSKFVALSTPAGTARLHSVTSGAVGSNSVVAVGDSGTILGCSPANNTCTAEQSGVAANLNDIWAENSNDIWAVGDSGTILRMKQ